MVLLRLKDIRHQTKDNCAEILLDTKARIHQGFLLSFFNLVTLYIGLLNFQIIEWILVSEEW